MKNFLNLVATASLLFITNNAFAADVPAAFKSQSFSAVMSFLDADKAVASNEIDLDVPEIAETATSVTINIKSKIQGTESIAVVVEKNPFPMMSNFVFTNGSTEEIATRLKIAKTSKVIVIVRAGGKIYKASKEVKVTAGGCGG